MDEHPGREGGSASQWKRGDNVVDIIILAAQLEEKVVVDKEDSDEDGHSTRNTLRGNEEADPAHNDKHPSWEVVSNDVVGPAGNIDIFFLSLLNNRNIYIFLRRVNSNPVTE